MARKPMKDDIFGKTGAHAVARVAKAGKAAEAPAAQHLVTTFRVAEKHLVALKDEAFRRAKAGGALARPDSSAVLRDVLDAWIQGKK